MLKIKGGSATFAQTIMIKIKRNKVLARIIAASFALNSCGFSMMPMIAQAADAPATQAKVKTEMPKTLGTFGYVPKGKVDKVEVKPDGDGKIVRATFKDGSSVESYQDKDGNVKHQVEKFMSDGVEATYDITIDGSNQSSTLTKTFDDGSQIVKTGTRSKNASGRFNAWQTNEKVSNPDGSDKETLADKAWNAQQQKQVDSAAGVVNAKKNQQTVEKAMGSIISLKDKDDVAFLRSIQALTQDPTGKTSMADNWKALVEAATAAKTKADENQAKLDDYNQGILDANTRMEQIMSDLQTRNVPVDKMTKTMIENYKKIYSNGMARLKTCKAEAAAAGKDDSSCVLTPEEQTAANVMLAHEQQQINENTNAVAKKNATEQAGKASSESNNKSSETKSSKTEKQQEMKCYEGTVLSGDGKCCPQATPIYDKKADKCVPATQQQQTSNKDDDNGNDGFASMLPMMCAIMPQNCGMGGKAGTGNTTQSTGKTESSPNGGNGTISTGNKSAEYSRVSDLSYEFNYEPDKKAGLTYLPTADGDKKGIKFRLNGSPTIKKIIDDLTQQGTYVGERIELSVPLSLSGSDKLEYYTRTIQEDQILDFYTGSNAEKGKEYLFNGQKVIREPAKNKGRKFYTATVKYYIYSKDGVHQYVFGVLFDFQDAATRLLPIPKNKISSHAVTIQNGIEEYNLVGKIAEAVWDPDSKSCRMNVKGQVYEKMTQSVSDEDITYTDHSIKNKDQCDSRKGKEITVNDASFSDDGQGHSEFSANGKANVGYSDEDNYDIYKNESDKTSDVSVKTRHSITIGSATFSTDPDDSNVEGIQIGMGKDGNYRLMKKDKESGDLVPFNDNDLAYMKAQSGVDFNDIRSCEPGSSQMCMFDENDMKMSQISDNGFADSHTTVKYLNEDGSPSDRDVRFKDYNSARMATEKMIGTSNARKRISPIESLPNRTLAALGMNDFANRNPKNNENQTSVEESALKQNQENELTNEAIERKQRIKDSMERAKINNAINAGVITPENL